VAIEQDQLLEWKRQYGVIFQGGTEDYQYCFRPLTVNEYNALAGNQGDSLAEQVDIEDTIVSTCLLHPSIDEYGSWPAGLAASLVDAIIISSGWGDENDIVKRFAGYQEGLGTYLNQFKMVVTAAEMGYSWSELDNKSVDQIIELAAAANEILQIKAAVAAGNPPQLELTGDGEIGDEDSVARRLHEVARKEGFM
jgi:hypothetical protein